MILCAGIGWIAGALLIILVGFVMAPAITGHPHSLLDPIDLMVLGLALLGMTPGGLLGGVVGGRIAREGGGQSQQITAALMGIVFSFPFGCMGLWLLGW
jgi:hypothetical protein